MTLTEAIDLWGELPAKDGCELTLDDFLSAVNRSSVGLVNDIPVLGGKIPDDDDE